MQTRWERLGTLAVALTLVGGGALGLDVGRAAAAAPAAMAAPGAGISAPVLYRLQQPTANNQGSDGGEVENAAEDERGAENESEAESESVGDEAIDGIDCVQEGAHQGENEGC